ncbi:hypothetical protein Glove_629g15 [Diversispora epigaea]|uniref:Uncharacterized protein n=1 Tax=Diversispora epigaea TaxID=1348612 RepID=A0A397G579_9GLOM|nr:hypothetical protein Glove_629g15 [Diversispora epigaea]
MFSQLILISTLLVGIVTVAIGAPVAIEIPQTRYGNLTLNRRFISGVPGLPQCIDTNFPDLVNSSCIDENSIRAYCAPANNPSNQKECDTGCPEDTTCMDFRTESEGGPYAKFAICISDKSLKDFGEGGSGEVCKSFKTDIKSDKGTVSINVYDSTARPVQVSSISIYTHNQVFTKSNTSTYSIIINVGSAVVKTVKVCVEIAARIYVAHVFYTIINEAFGG